MPSVQSCCRWCFVETWTQPWPNWGLVVRWDPTYVTRRGAVFYIGIPWRVARSVIELTQNTWEGVASAFEFLIWLTNLLDRKEVSETSAKTTTSSFSTGATHLAALGYLSLIFIYGVTRVLQRRFYNSEQLYFAKTVCQCITQTFVWRWSSVECLHVMAKTTIYVGP